MLRADYVKCNKCEEVMYVPVTVETCPKCHGKGFLQFINDQQPSVEVSEDSIEKLPLDDLKEMLEEQENNLTGLYIVAQLTGLEYENFIFNSDIVLNSSIVRCSDGDYIIPLLDKENYDVANIREIDKDTKKILSNICRELQEFTKVHFLDLLEGLDSCDLCKEVEAQENLINIDPHDFDESNLLTEYEHFDGMVCKKCHTNIQKH